MARPNPTGKRTVNLTSPGTRGSRIRRDPPPVAKKIVVRDPKERERSDAVVGVLTFALAIFVITLAAASYSGWSPRQYTVELRTAE